MITRTVFRLLDVDGRVLQEWTSCPQRLDLPNGDVVFGAKPGWENDAFRLAAAEVDIPELSLSPSGPQAVSMRQVRLALLQAGLLAQVDEAVAQADEVTKITWEYATEVHRDDPILAALAAQVGLNAQQVDALFEAAGAIT